MQETKETQVQPLSPEVPLEELQYWQPTPVFLPGDSHGQRNLAGYTVHWVAESDTTEAI